jgi:hypothetical protein
MDGYFKIAIVVCHIDLRISDGPITRPSHW